MVLKKLFPLLLAVSALAGCGQTAPEERAPSIIDDYTAAQGEDLSRKTLQGMPVDDTHWTLHVTHWVDDWEPPTATVGYSTAVLNYEKTKDGWQFTNLDQDVPNLDAETVFTFTYEPELLETYAYQEWSALQLALFLLHAEGHYFEGPAETLTDWLWEYNDQAAVTPEEVIAALAVLQDSPFPDKYTVITAPAEYIFRLSSLDNQPEFRALLKGYDPKDPREKAVIDKILEVHAENWAREEAVAAEMDNEFSLHRGSDMLTLGSQEDEFPWGYDLEGTLVHSGSADTYGFSYDMNCGDLTLSYFEHKEVPQYLCSMTTAAPEITTQRGAYCGMSEQDLVEMYPEAVPYDDGWLYEPGGYASCKHIFFSMEDGAVSLIEITDLLDGRLLNE